MSGMAVFILYLQLYNVCTLTVEQYKLGMMEASWLVTTTQGLLSRLAWWTSM